MIISKSVSRVLFFPSSSLSSPRSLRSPHRASASLFALAIFFHPLFSFSLRFKVVIFSRPPFFQPVLCFASLLIFFFGLFLRLRFRSSRPSSPPLLECALPTLLPRVLQRIFFVHLLSSFSSRFPSFTSHVLFLSKSYLTDSFVVFLFPFVLIVFELYLPSNFLASRFENFIPIHSYRIFYLFSHPFFLSSLFFILDSSYIPPQIFFL